MSLEIVLGPMFSGKSSYALSYIRKQRVIGRSVIAIKPALDKRYSNKEEIVTHNKERVSCVVWDSDIPLTPNRFVLQTDCIIVEEAQFFKGLPFFCNYLIGLGKQLVLVGLDGDARQTPFRKILDCIPLANKVTKLTALCSVCNDGTEAPYTRYKLDYNPSTTQIDIGGADKYEAVCLKCLHRK
jgi:thymidine kinase